MSDLVRYDAMCTAIAECHQVDEVKDLRDKAMALELYAKQARNTDAERRASEIRLRAERRTGELLKELARSTPAEAGAKGNAAQGKDAPPTVRSASPSPYAQALQETGISTQTASRYQALANVPKPVFEEALRDPVVKPTTARLIQQARAPQPQMPDDVLWLWGRMRDFERDAFASKEPRVLLDSMTDSMRADVARIAPLMADFFTGLLEASHDHA